MTVALNDVQSWLQCEAGGLSLDMFQIESEQTEQAFEDRCLLCPEFASQYIFHNIPEDGDL
jgi:hypothetical protein